MKNAAPRYGTLRRPFTFHGVDFDADQWSKVLQHYAVKVLDDDTLLNERRTDRWTAEALTVEGLKIIRMLARHLQPGESPSELVYGLLTDAGFDVPETREELGLPECEVVE